MKTIYISLVLWFLFSIPSLGQVLVQNNGYKQVETSIAVHPNNSNSFSIFI